MLCPGFKVIVVPAGNVCSHPSIWTVTGVESKVPGFPERPPSTSLKSAGVALYKVSSRSPPLRKIKEILLC